jgi:C4-dicarboxylate-specific signal transduction histidine kinase
VRDITAQKRGEKEVEELRNNLVHMTRVNTMSVLSGSLAHELNQPLGIILTNAQAAQDMLLEEQPDIAEVQAALTSIIAADRRAGDVIRQLRALLKRGQLAIKLLSLNEVIEEVLHLAHSDLIGRGVSVVHELAQDLPAVPGDRVHLQQLVLNLLLNGAEAMADNEPGSRRIYLRTEAKGNVVHFSVRDEGCGLPPDTNQIFDPFFTTKREGLGMGLPICSSIVAAHNGRIWAEPGLDRGAAFHVELPVTEIQENK